MVLPNGGPSAEGTVVCPGLFGATNWMSPSFDPQTGLFYVALREECLKHFRIPQKYEERHFFWAGASHDAPEEKRWGALRALDPRTGETRWEFKYFSPPWGGALSTAGGLVFSADMEGYLMAFDAGSGKELWHFQTGAAIYSSPMTYAVAGKQHVVIPSQNALLAFALPDVEEGASSRLDQRSPRQSDRDIHVLIVTGGHPFEEGPFFKMFDEISGIKWDHVRFGEGAENRLSVERARDYDAIVFYDMWQKSEPNRKNLIELLEQGKGMVFLHHALGSYEDWDEYGRIVGGHAYFLSKRSTFKHGVLHRVHIADSSHPITRSLDDFDIVDEIYDNYEVNPDVHVILTTDTPESGKELGWIHTYKNSRVAYIQLGHDHTAYENENYRTLVGRAIRWAAGSLN